MTAYVVKNVRLLKVIQLVAMADKTGRWEPPLRKMRKEHRVRDETRNRHDTPPGRAAEYVVKPAEIGNTARGDTQRTQPVEIFVAGAADQQLLLALEQQPPDCVLLLAVTLPILLHRKVGGRIRPVSAHQPLRAHPFPEVRMAGRRVNRVMGAAARYSAASARHSWVAEVNRSISWLISAASLAKRGRRR